MKKSLILAVGIIAYSSLSWAQQEPKQLTISKTYNQGTEYEKQDNRTKISLFDNYIFSSRKIELIANNSIVLGEDDGYGYKNFDIGQRLVESKYPRGIETYRFKEKKSSIGTSVKLGDNSFAATFGNQVNLFYVKSIGSLSEWILKERESSKTVPFDNAIGTKIIKIKNKNRAVILWSHPTKIILSIWDFSYKVDILKTIHIEAKAIGKPKMAINADGELVVAYQSASGTNMLGVNIDKSFTSNSFVKKWYISIPELKSQILNDVIIDSKGRAVCALNSNDNTITKILQLSSDHQTVNIGNVSYLDPKNWSRNHKKSNPIPNTTNKKINFDKQSDTPTAGLMLMEKIDDGSYILLACPSKSTTEYNIPKIDNGNVSYKNEKHANDNIFLINIDNKNLLPYSWEVILADKYKDESGVIYNPSTLSQRFGVKRFETNTSADSETGEYVNQLTILRSPMRGYGVDYDSRKITVRLKLSNTNNIDMTSAFKAKYASVEKLDEANGYYAVKKGDLLGVVDAQDNIILPIEYYQYINYNSEHKVFKVLSKSEEGFVDLDNKIVFPFAYSMRGIHSGIVQVNPIYDDPCYYVNISTGEKVSPLIFEKGENFIGDKAKVWMKQDDGTVKTGYLYKSGKLVYD